MLRRALARAALAALGVALGLLVLEVALQVAAQVRPAPRSIAVGPRASAVGERRILCVGDSHTYGIWVDAGDTYPARLQRKLPDAEVLNAGVPGMNSSQVRNVLPELLARYRPDVVLLMVGVADFWNLDSLRAEHYRGWRWLLRAGGGLFDRSRVVKLWRLLRFNLEYGREPLAVEAPVVEHTPFNWQIKGGGRQIDVDIDMHFEDGLKDELVFRRLLRHNLASIAADVEAQGAALVLMTYPTDQGLYGAVNTVYRGFAESAGLPLIDLGAATAAWQRPPFAEIAYFPDFHPRRAGYELVARLVAEALGGAPSDPGR